MPWARSTPVVDRTDSRPVLGLFVFDNGRSGYRAYFDRVECAIML